MRLRPANSTAVLTALALLATPMGVAAQTQTAPTVTPPAPAAPAAPAPGPGQQAGQAAGQPAPAQGAAAAPERAGVQVPPAVAELGMTDAEVSEGRRGDRVRGILPGGVEAEAMIGRDGALRGVRSTDDDVGLPADVVARLVPQAVRDAAIYREIATVTGVMISPKGVMVGGKDADGEAVRAGFSNDGTLQRFGRGEMERPEPRGPHGEGHREKHRKHGEPDGGKHGRPDGDGDRGEGRRHGAGPDAEAGDPQDQRTGPDRDASPDRGGDRPRGPAGNGDARPALDEAAARSALDRAGYTQPGTILRAGPRTLAEAVNPAGEPVTVELNPRGEVVRETAR